MTSTPFVYFEDQLNGIIRHFSAPLRLIRADTPDEIQAALNALQKAHDDGYYLAGSLSYELGYWFEDRLRPLMQSRAETPYILMGVFGTPNEEPLHITGHAGLYDLSPKWNEAEYTKKFNQIKHWLKRGDVYQVNLTFPLEGRYLGTPANLYASLKTAQPVRYGAIVALDETASVSLSPELFFEIQDEVIFLRPMKGTIQRGKSAEQDQRLKSSLQADGKNRAENLMIVDLLRNDVARIARPGSVKVTDLFTVETYPSLHTMTSGIKAQIKTTEIQTILSALFPCGSVTGAPKIRAMQIIEDLETTPRGVYCGAMGWIAPSGDMRFNVGIRTLSLNPDGRCRYGTGSGIVMDSNVGDEYRECLLKAKFLRPSFDLIETFSWHEQTGLMWEELHIERLRHSARTLSFEYEEADVRLQLAQAVRNLHGAHKLRLALTKSGKVHIQASPFHPEAEDTIWPVTLSTYRIDSRDALLAHKTTRREFIETELIRLRNLTGCREVLFLNEKDEVCEGSFTNVFVLREGQYLTPPLASGLLPGVLRQALLDSGEAQECVLTVKDLQQARQFYIGNSVRGLIPVRLTGPNPV